MMLALVGLIALTLGVATLPNGAEMRARSSAGASALCWTTRPTWKS